MGFNLKQRTVTLAIGLADHYRRHLVPYAAAVIASVGFFSNFTFAVNVTESLPGHLFLVQKGVQPNKAGDLVAFHFMGDLPGTPYRHGAKFLKITAGMPGDIVGHAASMVTVNEWKLHPQEKTRNGIPMQPLSFSGTIPANSYFAVGLHPRSLDSRYEQVGLVKSQEVIGVAHALF